MYQEFIQTLQAARSPDTETRRPAEEKFQFLEQTQLAVFVGLLSQVLSDEQIPVDLRSLAGITLKNVVSARSATRKAEISERWLQQDPKTIDQIHVILLNTLSSASKEARQASSIAIAAFAAIEIPNNRWTDLFSKLTTVSMQTLSAELTPSSINLVVACFNTIGYILDALETDSKIPVGVNEILNLIFQGTNCASDEVRFSALRALQNSIVFAHDIFKAETYSTTIFKMILDGIKAGNPDIVDICWQCLVTIVYNYYDVTPALSQNILNIFELSLQTISKADVSPNTAVQAIEFWITIAEIEKDIAHENLDHYAPEDMIQSLDFCKAANDNTAFYEAMFFAATQQAEDPEDEEWTPASAAGLCLSFFVELLGESVATKLINFCAQNLRSDVLWKPLEATLVLFGCAMEAPILAESTLNDATNMLMHIVTLISSPEPHVHITSVWAVSQYVKMHYEALSPPQIQAICEALMYTFTRASPRSCSYACSIIMELSNRLNDDQYEDAPLGPQATEMLSSITTTFMNQLLQTSSQLDLDKNVLVSCYECISRLVKNSPDALLEDIKNLIPEFTKRLISISVSALNNVSNEDMSNIQGLVCGSLQCIISRITQWESVSVFADSIITTLANVMSSKSSTAQEEALITIGSIATCAGKNFAQYMDVVGPIVMKALQQKDQAELLSTALLTLSNIATAFESDFKLYIASFYPSLQDILQSDVDKEVKLVVFETLVDFALTIGGEFVPYLQSTMSIIRAAMLVSFWDGKDELLFDYCFDLQDKLILCINGLVTSLSSDNQGHTLAPYIEGCLDYARAVFMADNASEQAQVKVCELFKDIFDYAPQISPDIIYSWCVKDNFVPFAETRFPAFRGHASVSIGKKCVKALHKFLKMCQQHQLQQ